MLPNYLLLSLHLLPSLVLSSPLKSSDDTSFFSNPSFADIDLTNTTTNSTIQPLLQLNPDTTANLGAVQIRCERSTMGAPPYASCLEVIGRMRNDFSRGPFDPPRSYGPRELAVWEVGLPKRWISSDVVVRTADGRCIIDLRQSAAPSFVRDTDLHSSALGIQSQCIRAGFPINGGHALGLGEKDDFNLALRGYIPPSVRCTRKVPSLRPVLTDCQTLIGDMNVISWPMRFGARGAQGVQEVLPKTLREGGCQITFSAPANREDTASWYDLWQAAVAMNGMCVQQGRSGVTAGLGANHNIMAVVSRP
ncbi:RCC1 repeat-containing protein C10F6.04 [Physcia stellaris]|nr:RCC1 repeat-containing protein C10F6.04 [Physcia stellaris]